MFILYTAVVIAVIALLFWILYSNKLLKVNLILCISLISIVMSLGFPFVVGSLASLNMEVGIVFIITFSIYTGIAFMTSILIVTLDQRKDFSVVIKQVICDVTKRTGSRLTRKFDFKFDGTYINGLYQNYKNILVIKDKLINKIEIHFSNRTGEKDTLNDFAQEKYNENTAIPVSDIDIIKLDEDTFEMKELYEVIENEQIQEEAEGLDVQSQQSTDDEIIDECHENVNIEAANICAEIEINNENIVDSGRFIDTIENENTINDYINEAFRLKQEGDLEGAILQYMYALERKPEQQISFWLVLDICVLYKTLGQSELAREMLKSFSDEFGHLMEDNLKIEIEKNLS